MRRPVPRPGSAWLALLLLALPAAGGPEAAAPERLPFFELPAASGSCYAARVGGLDLWTDEEGIAFRVPGRASSLFELRFLGTAGAVDHVTESESPTRLSLLRGRDPATWRLGLVSHEAVSWRGLWPGVDLRHELSRRSSKGTFRVEPGADPAMIRLAYRGLVGLETLPDGSLLLRTTEGAFREPAPVAWEELGSTRRRVAVSYVVSDDAVVSFRLGPRDPSRPLVIDPEIVASTYLGPSSSNGSWRIEGDAGGSLVVLGKSASPDFPVTPGAHDETQGGGSEGDVFLARLSGDLTTLEWATFVGGSGNETIGGLHVAADGTITAVGGTDSADFPVSPGAYQQTFAGFRDAFVLRLAADGSTLLWSTLVGGSGLDDAQDLSVDSDGSVVVAARASRDDFPTTPGAFDRISAGGAVLRVSNDGARLIFSTFLGPGAECHDAAIAPDGSLYLTGRTQDASFPATPGAFAESKAAGHDAFVTRLSGDGSAVLASTFLGGAGEEIGRRILLDDQGRPLVAGRTESADFPSLTGGFQPAPAGRFDGFVCRLDAGLATLERASFVGGTGDDAFFGLVRDPLGRVGLAGYSSSAGYPLTPGGLPNRSSNTDFVLTVLEPELDAAAYSTYWGGDGRDFGTGLAVTGDGRFHLVGYTESIDIPTTPGVFRDAHAGTQWDTNVTSFDLSLSPSERDCSNGLDDDADGATDCEDADCAATEDCRPDGDPDGDGVPNQADCAPFDGGSSAVPEEVADLRIARSAGELLLSWSDPRPAAGSASESELARSALGALVADGGATAPCVASVTEPFWSESPGAGDRYFLVRAVNACGPPAGTGWGLDSTDRQRPACP